MKSILFLHRSVGQNLINDGEMHELVREADSFAFSDYNQNTDILTDLNGEKRKMGFIFPSGNTRPQDLSVIFSENTPERYKPIQEKALRYDIVVIKSCYPNSNIASDQELEGIKQHYVAICSFFAKQNRMLIILTSPPLTPLMTKPDKAKRARELSDWLVNTDFGASVKVFNLFDLLAISPRSKQANMLKKEYRRWLPTDSHPNTRASKEIASKLVSFFVGDSVNVQ